MTDETPTTSPSITKTIDTYQAVWLTFVTGYIRLYKASVAVNSASLILKRNPRLAEDVKELDPLRGAVNDPLVEAFDGMRYVTNVSFLVYATALLDTFLTETTIFLFLLLPHSMGKSEQIPLKTLIESKSRSDALRKVALRRAKQISYRSFDERLQLLNKIFGLKLAFEDKVLDELRRCSEMRNRAVHDQGYFELKLDENGEISHKQRSCELHPIRIKDDDPFRAADVYDEISRQVARAVFVQVLKYEGPEVV